MFKKLGVLLAGMSLASLVQADGIGLGAHVGLMGPGVDAFYRINDKLMLHGAYNQFDYDYDTSEDDVDYDATYAFKNAQLGLDWYPFAGAFRLSAAYVLNGNEIDMHAVPKGGTYSLNNTIYAGSEVADARANIDYADSAAYIGLGWGNPVFAGKGLGVTFDIGAVYVGEPDVSLTAVCGTTVRCAQLQADAEVERRTLEDDLSDFPLWPLVQLGLTYNF